MLECHLLKTIQESDLFHYLVPSYKIDHWHTRVWYKSAWNYMICRLYSVN